MFTKTIYYSLYFYILMVMVWNLNLSVKLSLEMTGNDFASGATNWGIFSGYVDFTAKMN